MDHNRPPPGRPNMPTLPSITTLNPSLIYEYNVGNSPQSRQQNHPYNYSHDPYYQPRHVRNPGSPLDGPARSQEPPRRNAIEDVVEPTGSNTNSYTFYHSAGRTSHNGGVAKKRASPCPWEHDVSIHSRPPSQTPHDTSHHATNMYRKRKVQDMSDPASYPQQQKHRNQPAVQHVHNTVPVKHATKPKRHVARTPVVTHAESYKRSISPAKNLYSSIAKNQTWERVTEYTGIPKPIRKGEDVHVRVEDNVRLSWF